MPMQLQIADAGGREVLLVAWPVYLSQRPRCWCGKIKKGSSPPPFRGQIRGYNQTYHHKTWGVPLHKQDHEEH
jgi:hypothetical protein